MTDDQSRYFTSGPKGRQIKNISVRDSLGMCEGTVTDSMVSPWMKTIKIFLDQGISPSIGMGRPIS